LIGILELKHSMLFPSNQPIQQHIIVAIIIQPDIMVSSTQIRAQPYDFPHNRSPLVPDNTALVVIDMQRDFCEPGGYITESQGYEPLRAAIPNVLALLNHFRACGYPVYFTREGHRPDLSTLSSREQYRSRLRTGKGIGDEGSHGKHLIRGEPGHQIIDKLQPLPGEPIIDKPGRGAFAHTDFELLLRLRGIRNLILVGVTTDVCVHTTMREANDRGFDVCLVEDATEAGTPELHKAAIASIKEEGGIFGCVATKKDVVMSIVVGGD
jgi:nicotinamidase-related amidase